MLSPPRWLRWDLALAVLFGAPVVPLALSKSWWEATAMALTSGAVQTASGNILYLVLGLFPPGQAARHRP